LRKLKKRKRYLKFRALTLKSRAVVSLKEKTILEEMAIRLVKIRLVWVRKLKSQFKQSIHLENKTKIIYSSMT
jgi:hypothetical protein